jgi:hypothetical protein
MVSEENQIPNPTKMEKNLLIANTRGARSSSGYLPIAETEEWRCLDATIYRKTTRYLRSPFTLDEDGFERAALIP